MSENVPFLLKYSGRVPEFQLAGFHAAGNNTVRLFSICVAPSESVESTDIT